MEKYDYESSQCLMESVDEETLPILDESILDYLDGGEA